MKIIFLGTPMFSRTVLEHIINSNHEVVAVVTQPDRKNTRGNIMLPSPVKLFAISKNIPVYQYASISKEGEEDLKALNADIIVTASFGQILRQNILDLTPFGVVNVHASLLPLYRGASPVQTAILYGDNETGVTIMKTQLGIDTGDILCMDKTSISPEDNAETLMQKLAVLGGELIVSALDSLENGTVVYTPQNHLEATTTKMLKKEDAYLDFNKTALELNRFIRAYYPHAKVVINGQEFKVVSSFVRNGLVGRIGEIVESSSKFGLLIQCRDGILELDEIIPPNSKKMLAKSFLNGHAITKGIIVG